MDVAVEETMTSVQLSTGTRPGKLVRLVAYGALLYNVAVIALLILRVTIDERIALIGFVNYGLMWVLLLTLPCALLCLLVLKWRGAVALIPAALFLAFYAPQLLPKPQEAGGLRVATYNITGWLETPEKLRAFKSLDVDILGIQESINPEELLAQTEGIYPYVYVQRNAGFTEHFALYSRYPIDTDSIRFIDYSLVDWIRPASMRAVVNVDGQPISVYVMHTTRPDVNPFAFDSEARDKGLLWTLDAIRAETNPVIVLCDCNMSEWTAGYQWMSDALTDSWRERGAGFGLTVPATRNRAPFPLIRGDYIWHSAHFTTVSVQVMPDSGGSEHFPLQAVLRLNDAH